jgi:hypothetical protein
MYVAARGDMHGVPFRCEFVSIPAEVITFFTEQKFALQARPFTPRTATSAAGSYHERALAKKKRRGR